MFPNPQSYPSPIVEKCIILVKEEIPTDFDFNSSA